MIEPPQFRTVLRGADPEQVAETMKELQTSLVVARRAAADRTIELSRLQEEHQSLQERFAATQRQLGEPQQPGQPGQTGQQGPAQPGGSAYSDLGARIGSMLSLAEEEATQIRATAEAEAAKRRDHAVRALAAELAAEEARLDEIKARTAALGEELARLRARGDAENERLREQATQEADHIRQQAQSDADALHRRAEEQRAGAVAHRDTVHEHLSQIVQLIGGVLEGEPEQPADRPVARHETSERDQERGTADPPAAGGTGEAEAQGSNTGGPQARGSARTGMEPTVDDLPHSSTGDHDRDHDRDHDPDHDPDVTVPDATHPDHVDGPAPTTPVNGSDRPARRAAFAPRRPSDATQVMPVVPAPASPPSPPTEPSPPRPPQTRESRRQHADAGDSFAGEPWQEDDRAQPRNAG